MWMDLVTVWKDRVPQIGKEREKEKTPSPKELYAGYLKYLKQNDPVI